MEHLPKKTCQNGISYTLVGDYYIPDLQLPEESRPIGIWGRMHKEYLEQYHPAQYNDLILSGRLWTYLLLSLRFADGAMAEVFLKSYPVRWAIF